MRTEREIGEREDGAGDGWTGVSFLAPVALRRVRGAVPMRLAPD